MGKNPLGDGPIVVPIARIPASHSQSIIAICLVCALMSWSLFGLRMWTRAAIVGTIGYDDATMLAALLFFSVYCSSVMAICFMFGNREYLTGQMMTVSTNLLIIAEVFYVITMVTLKLSLGIFFARIMVSKGQRAMINVILFFSTLMGIAFAFFIVFQCGTPVEATLYWQRRAVGQCVSNKAILAMSYSHAAITSSTDLLLTLLPIPMLMKSQIRNNEKWIVGGILAVATAGFMASVARIYWIPALTVTNYDFLKEIELLAIWSAVEPGMGMSATSLATLRPLLRMWRKKAKQRRGLSSGSGGRNWRLLGTSKASSKSTPRSTGLGKTITVTTTLDVKSTTKMSYALNTVDVVEFLDISRSDSTESLPQYQSRPDTLQIRTFQPQTQIYSGKARSDGWSFPYSVLDMVPELAVPERAASSQRRNRRLSRAGSEDERERVRNMENRGTWWPLPRDPIIPVASRWKSNLESM